MKVISYLAFVAAAGFFLTGLSVMKHPHVQARITGNDSRSEPVLTSQQPVPAIATPQPQVQPTVPATPKPTAIPRDDLISQPWWQDQIKDQVNITQGSEYNACLFGDSISSRLGNTLGHNTFNFAIGSMSTVSLVEQLKILKAAQVKCKTAIIAMGTNDAEYMLPRDKFINNLKQSIELVKSMKASDVVLIPAFYSTVEASHNREQAGTIAEVEEINALIRQVAATSKAIVFEDDIKALYQGQALRKDVTTDGVHLNAEGNKIYRRALLKLLSVRLKPALECQQKNHRSLDR